MYEQNRDYCKSGYEKNGKVYNDFEGVLIYYKQYGKVDGEISEVLEFNSIMEFLYLGRKSKAIN
ncbi:hypothetical protein [Clostridium boliviensis]|uniref:hypothetical protein n=1 Tax=Clostridium boliviensis TaxID=318465 RepID=UPI00296493C6|nr:hypothetical protein [Clostridium boliviensis]